MPELPEVETIRLDLVSKVLNTKIVRVVVYTKKIVGESTQFVRTLEGNEFSAIERRGKLLIFRLKNGNQSVLVHLKMTGQLIYEIEKKGKVEIVAGGHKMSENDLDALPNKFTKVAFVFANGGELFFNDMRMFGYMHVVNEPTVQKALSAFGPEPFSKDFTFTYFSNLFKKRKGTNLKAFLLNQELVAGLGNIYVDEVCWYAGVRPMRRVGTVSMAEQKKLFEGIPKILKEALKHRGTTFRNFLDSSGKKGNYTDFLKVYDRDGQKCKRCDSIIKKTKIAGRGTHYCPRCQS